MNTSARKILPLLTAFLLLLSPLAAQESGQEQEQQRSPLEVSRQLQAEELEVPPPYRDKVEAGGQTIMELTLQDAIRLALLHNLDIAIENFNEELTREQIVSTRGFYDPALEFSVGWQDAESPTISDLEAGEGAEVFAQKQFSYSGRLLQNLPSGADFSVSYFSNRSDSNSAFQFANPAYRASFSANFRQPLWRGFRETQTQRLLKLRNLDLEINDLQFEVQVSLVIQQVQDRYWELVFAINNYETRREGMALAITQHKNNQKRVNIGVSAPIEITSSRAEVALREQEMISSEVQIINAQNRLKQLMSDDPKASIWSLSVYPTDTPRTPEIKMTLNEAVDLALQNRPELKQVESRLEQDAVDQTFFKKELKPQVDLRLSYTSNAAGGGEASGLGDVFTDAFSFNFHTWSAFVDVRIPLGNRTMEGNLAQARIRERQNLSRLKNAQQGIIVEVRNAFEGLKTQGKRLESARLARELSEEQLRGENRRFQAGFSTNFQVLRFQRDLTSAEAQELRALIDYEQAVTALMRATHQIIEQSQVSLARGQDQP
ncbi:MAG TPA: TolC family protein [Acidobacteriota bacterium]|nr:TolC family protein [Acidobacteriota bacterium]